MEWWGGGVRWGGLVPRRGYRALAQGFNPGNCQFANGAPCTERQNKCEIGRRVDAHLSPRTGRDIRIGKFPGLKPWAKVHNPFGAPGPLHHSIP